MIPRFFSRAPRSDIHPARVPAGRRIYAVGDIHGCIEPLRELQRHILDHAAAAPQPELRNVVIYLGDYVDRGTDSRAVIDLLLQEPLPGFEHIYLKGNHEEGLLRFLVDEQYGPQWFTFGGEATLYSYGTRPPQRPSGTAGLQQAQREFSERLPQEHLDFFRRLRLHHTEGDYLFVHAGIRPGVALERQAPDDLLWIRDEFLRSDLDFGKTVVHGHSISESPVVRRNRIGIDTGAFASGHLTCLILEDADRSFLAT